MCLGFIRISLSVLYGGGKAEASMAGWFDIDEILLHGVYVEVIIC